MNRIKLRARFFSVLTAIGILLGTGYSVAVLGGCGGEDCLVRGENCSQQYKLDNYGTTSIWCCEGQCSEHGYGDFKYLTCGS